MRKFYNSAMLAVVSASALVAVGCASNEDHPYKLTGNESANGRYIQGYHGQPGQYVPQSNGYSAASERTDSDTYSYPVQPRFQSKR